MMEKNICGTARGKPFSFKSLILKKLVRTQFFESFFLKAHREHNTVAKNLSGYRFGGCDPSTKKKRKKKN